MVFIEKLQIQVGICCLFGSIPSSIPLEEEVSKIRVHVVPRGPERAVSPEKVVLGQPVVVQRVTKFPVKGPLAAEAEAAVESREGGMLIAVS